MKIAIILISFLSTLAINAQTIYQVEDSNGNYDVKVLDEEPDLRIMYLNFRRNIYYPALARENEIQGTTFISILVDTNGKLLSSEISKGFYKACDDEALRAVRLLKNIKKIVPIIYFC